MSKQRRMVGRAVVGGTAVATVASAFFVGCGSSGGGTLTTTSTTTSYLQGSTSTTTETLPPGTTTVTASPTSTSSTTTQPGTDGGDAGDATVADAGDAAMSDAGDASDTGTTACNTASALLGDAGAVLFSFDDGGITQTIPGSTVNWSTTVNADPSDAGLTVSKSGDPVTGDTCPGSLLITIPFTTTGQKGTAEVFYPSPPGFPVTGTALHIALKAVVTNALDGGVVPTSSLVIADGGNYSYLQAFAQWAPPGPDGGAPDAAYLGNGYQTFTNLGNGNGWAGFPSDGGWLLSTVPFVVPDGGAATTPMTVYLNHFGLVLLDPTVPTDGGVVGLPFPTTLWLYVDDIYVQ